MYDRFKDIPQFTSIGAYEVNQPFHRFDKFIDNMIREFGLQLNPDFQRGHVWTDEQQIRFLQRIAAMRLKCSFYINLKRGIL